MKWSELPKEYQDLEKGFDKEAFCGMFINPQSSSLADRFKWKYTPHGQEFWKQCYCAETILDLPQIPGNESNKS